MIESKSMVTQVQGKREKWITKRREETVGGNGNVHCLDCDKGFMGIYLTKFITLYTSNMYRLLYSNYASIKL